MADLGLLIEFFFGLPRGTVVRVKWVVQDLSDHRIGVLAAIATDRAVVAEGSCDLFEDPLGLLLG